MNVLFFNEKNREFTVKPVPCLDIVDATGAGDVWCAGFLVARIVHKRDIEMACAYANAASSYCIRSIGATSGLPKWSEIERIVNYDKTERNYECLALEKQSTTITNTNDKVSKRKVKFFISYAHADKGLVDTFINYLKEQTNASKTYEYDLWRDDKILFGENWHKTITDSLKNSEVGLILISPSFLGSQYITDHELPMFIGKNSKPIIPILLQTVDIKRHDLKGLKEHQIFSLEIRKTNSKKAFGECVSNQRIMFAQKLFSEVEKRLDSLFNAKNT